MSFYVFTVIGVAASFLHLLLPSEHRVGPTSAFALGIAGAWGGALFVSAFVRGGWANFPAVAAPGAIVGALLAIYAIELFAERYVERERDAEA